METVLILLVIAGAIGWHVYTGGVPKRYRVRSCTGKNWKTSYPDASKEEIRRFLLLFTDAFAFSPKEKLKFEPEDRIMDIYRELYPLKWMADSLEVETLSCDIEEEYNFSLMNIWREDLTLGEVFEEVRNA